jgi:uncharacterized membrane protein
MRRAWARDPGLEVDAVGRKGRNADGRDTFFVQAPAPRAAALTRGFPERREDLYAYDAVVLANIEGDGLTRAQFTATAEFVSQRGGGLLVVGSRSFGGRGLGSTPVEEALPLELSDRGAPGAAPVGIGVRPATNKLVPTSEGERHPVMRIGDTQAETRQRWTALPALAFTSPVGGPRRGASVLAVTSAPTGMVYPVVAVQPYGRGRSMTFSGEASWRWKMMLPSTDHSFELFWRQAARWLASAAPDPVSMTLPEDVALDEEVPFDVDVRDAAFAPVGDATVDATLTAPDGGVKPVTLRRSAATGHFVAGLRFDRPGLYRVSAAARRGAQSLGDAARWLYAGASDPEFADPRLNDAWLRRLTRGTGGRYVRPPEASDIVKWLRESAPAPSSPSRRELWHQPWTFAAIVALLSAEWILRRRWGLQ